MPTGIDQRLDDGRTWKQSALQGVNAPPIAIAVHPTKADVVALATEEGLLLSADYGATVARVGEAQPATALTFGPDGTLLVGSTDLWSYDRSTKQMTSIAGPPMVEEEIITAIAVNPVDPQELAVATTQRNIYQSKNAGQEWALLAGNGVGVNPHP